MSNTRKVKDFTFENPMDSTLLTKAYIIGSHKYFCSHIFVVSYTFFSTMVKENCRQNNWIQQKKNTALRHNERAKLDNTITSEAIEVL